MNGSSVLMAIRPIYSTDSTIVKTKYSNDHKRCGGIIKIHKKCFQGTDIL